MSPGRVLMVVTSLGLGGAERQVELLATGLRRRGWAVRVVSLTSDLRLAAGLVASGVEVGCIGLPRGRPSIRGLAALAREYTSFRPDIVHAHMVHANLAARLARLVAPVPRLICTAHNTVEGGAFRGLWYRSTDGLAEITTQVSRIGLTKYVSSGLISASRGRFVRNGLPVDRFQPSRAHRESLRRDLELGDGFTWVCVARLAPAKDHATLLAAWRSYLTGRPGDSLLLVGEGPLEAQIRTMASDLAPGGSVRFLGARDDIPAILSAADGLVLASRWEGSPAAILEAGAAGLPVVATTVGGVPDLLASIRLHRAIPPGDAVSMAAAMGEIAVLSKPERARAALSTIAAVRDEYDLEAVLTEWEELYQSSNGTASRSRLSQDP